MALKEVNAHEVLCAFVRSFPQQKDAAEALGIGQAYLSDMLRGRRYISDDVLRQLGLRKTVVRRSA